MSLDKKFIQENTNIYDSQHKINLLYATIFNLNDNDSNNDLKINIFPFYYLFDNLIDENIGCTYQIRDTIMEILEFQDIFDIDYLLLPPIYCVCVICNYFRLNVQIGGVWGSYSYWNTALVASSLGTYMFPLSGFARQNWTYPFRIQVYYL